MYGALLRCNQKKIAGLTRNVNPINREIARCTSAIFLTTGPIFDNLIGQARPANAGLKACPHFGRVSTLKVTPKLLASHDTLGSLLREVDQVLPMMASDPRSIGRVWLTCCKAGQLPNKIDPLVVLVGIILQLEDVTLARFLTDVVLGEANLGKDWPSMFYQRAPMNLLARFHGIRDRFDHEQDRLIGRGFLEHSNVGLVECMRVLRRGVTEYVKADSGLRKQVHAERVAKIILSNGMDLNTTVAQSLQTARELAGTLHDLELAPLAQEASDILCGVLGAQHFQGHAVMPRVKLNGPLHPDHAERARRHDIPTLPTLGNGAGIRDAKADWVFSGGVDWVVPVEMWDFATTFVHSNISSILVPPNCQRYFLDLAARRHPVLRQIKEDWQSILDKITDNSMEDFRWISLAGVDLIPQICGYSGHSTGLVSVHLSPRKGEFPCLDLTATMSIYGHLVASKDVVNGGLMKDVESKNAPPEQLGFQLAINRMVVDFLLAFIQSPKKKTSGHDLQGKRSRFIASKDDADEPYGIFPKVPKARREGGRSRRTDGEAHRVSDDAKMRCKQYCGLNEPPTGCTFATSPPIKAGSEYKPKSRRYKVELT